MRRLLFEELRDVYREVEFSEADIQTIAEDAIQIDKLNHIGRMEGLLAIEAVSANEEYPAIVDYSEDGYDEEIRTKYHMQKLSNSEFNLKIIELMMLVSNGIDVNELYEIGLANSFSSGFTSFERLRYLFYLYGAIEIQVGACYWTLEHMMTAFIPKEARGIYTAWRTEFEQEVQKWRE